MDSNKFIRTDKPVAKWPMSLGMLGQYGSDSDSSTGSASIKEPSLPTHGKDFFDEQDFSSGSESRDNSEGGEKETGSPVATPGEESLPLPDLSRIHSGVAQAQPGSVFSNPFRDAEEAQLAVLKKHVELTEVRVVEADEEERRQARLGKKRRTRSRPPTQAGGKGEMFDENDSSIKTQVKKVRAGMPSGLTPSKKFMKAYHQSQSQERPWTMNTPREN